MHYKIKGLLIRSENTAKPIMDAAGTLVEWLSQRPQTRSALDYGCGKLRYTAHIADRSRYLGIVDSTEQLDRVQRITGIITTVRKFAKKKWPGCRVYDLHQFWEGIHHAYDFILCSNVLSAIPCPKVRARSLRSISRSLAKGGQLLVVNQHTNSYFCTVRRKPETASHLNGWILHSRKGGAYYGIFTKDITITLLKRFNFKVLEAWIDGQSNYVLVNRGE